MPSRCGEYKLVAAEQQSRCSDKQARCSGKYQQLGLPSLNQLVTAKTPLAVASALCLDQIEHEVQNSTYCSQFELPHCGENPIRCCEYSQH